jgi:hypothetical protein
VEIERLGNRRIGPLADREELRILNLASPLPPAEITSSLVREFAAYWQRQRGDRLAPHPRDIDPADIRRMLPYISIADVIAEPFDLRFRLVGTGVVEAAGYDFTGQYFHEMPVTTGMDKWWAYYARMVRERRPLYGRYRGDLDSDVVRYVDHGAFPLSSDGATVDRVIEIEDWSEIRGVALIKLELPIWQFEPLSGEGERDKLSGDTGAGPTGRPIEPGA